MFGTDLGVPSCLELAHAELYASIRVHQSSDLRTILALNYAPQMGREGMGRDIGYRVSKRISWSASMIAKGPTLDSN